MKITFKVVTCIIVFAAGVNTAQATTWSANLLTNPGAEAGDLSGWTTDDTVGAVVASQSLVQTTGTVYPYADDWFFNMAGASVGNHGVVKSRLLSQDIDVSGWASEIDAGLGLVNASTWLQTEDIPPDIDPNPSDMAQMTVFFLDDMSAEIDNETTGMVTTAPPNLTWVQYTFADLAIPYGTRALQLELVGEKHETTYINAFFDDVSLQVGIIPEPATICLLGFGALGLLRKRKV